MGKEIHFLSIDDLWDKKEVEIIDTLYRYGCLDRVDKDFKIIVGSILLKALLRRLTTCSIRFEGGLEGLETSLGHCEYPYVCFYWDKGKINRDKEILEHINYEEFVVMLEEFIRDFNTITNHKILTYEFPYPFKNLTLGEKTKTDTEIDIKLEILKSIQKRKNPIKKITKLASKYGITLSNLQKRKIFT